MRGRLALGVCAAGALAGCPSLGAYECASVADCDRVDGGVCLGDGACAYPDNGCDSGMRRSPNAASAPGACVDPTGTTTTSTGSAGPVSGSMSSLSGEAGTATSLPTEPASTSTAGEDCGFRKTLSIDTTVISAEASLQGYPLLVELADADLEGVAEVAFATEDGTPLPYDVERHDVAAGELLAWVRLPAWDPGLPLSLQLRYGELEPGRDVVPSEVWDDTFLGVWHMGADLSGTDGELVRDATSFGGHGTTVGSMGAGQVVPAIVGDGLMFDGDDDRVEIRGSFVGALESFTISAWVRDDSDGTIHAPFFARFNGDNLYPRCRKVASSGGILCQVGISDDTVTATSASSSTLPYEEWGHLTVTYDRDAGRIELFMGGDFQDATDGSLAALDAGDDPALLGFLGEFNTMLGMLDEVRLANAVLPDDWIRADSRLHRTPSIAIVDVGNPEPIPCGG